MGLWFYEIKYHYFPTKTSGPLSLGGLHCLFCLLSGSNIEARPGINCMVVWTENSGHQFPFLNIFGTGIQRFRVPPSHRAVGTGFRKKVTVVCTAQCLLTVVHRTYWCVAYIFEHLAGVFVWKPCVALHVTTKGQFRGLCRWLWATWL